MASSSKVPSKGKVNKAINCVKKENLVQIIQKKKECEKKAHEIVLKLIEPGVTKDYILQNALNISQHHMDDVIEERRLSELCGWVLCDNKVNPESIPKQTYAIRGHKVFDITERKSFCDGKCYRKATHFKGQLLTSPLWLRDIEEDVKIELLEDCDTTELQGLTVPLSMLKLDNKSSDNEDDSS